LVNIPDAKLTKPEPDILLPEALVKLRVGKVPYPEAVILLPDR
jgi:hypothetical protein